MELNLASNAAGALWNALSQHSVKGRRDARRHSRVVGALRAGATKKTEAPANATEEQIAEHQKRDLFEFCDGKIQLDEELMEYVEDIVDERLDAGVPGNIGHGYGQLVDAIEVLCPPEEKKAKK